MMGAAVGSISFLSAAKAARYKREQTLYARCRSKKADPSTSGERISPALTRDNVADNARFKTTPMAKPLPTAATWVFQVKPRRQTGKAAGGIVRLGPAGPAVAFKVVPRRERLVARPREKRRPTDPDPLQTRPSRRPFHCAMSTCRIVQLRAGFNGQHKECDPSFR